MRRERKPGADLRGIKVLVVEDEFYLAAELEEQVQQAGGTVLGPCPDIAAAMTQLDAGPNFAIVDINLGQGPSFEIARVLRERGTPFIFLTGYDEALIPPEFAGIECLQKPCDTSRVMDAIARLTVR